MKKKIISGILVVCFFIGLAPVLNDGRLFLIPLHIITPTEEFLSCLINSEAEHGNLEDMLLIGAVVLNRVEDGRFHSDSIEDVIFKKGQFDGVSTNNFVRSDMSDMVAIYLIRGGLRNYRVVFFYNPTTSTDRSFVRYVNNKYKVLAKTKRHIFLG